MPAEPLPAASAAAADAELDGLALGPSGAVALPEPPQPKPAAAARAPPRRLRSWRSARRAWARPRASVLGCPRTRQTRRTAAMRARRARARSLLRTARRARLRSKHRGSTPNSAPGPQKFLTLTPTLVLALTRCGCAPRSFQGGRQAARQAAQIKLQFKIPIGPVAEGAALLTDPPVEPPLMWSRALCTCRPKSGRA